MSQLFFEHIILFCIFLIIVYGFNEILPFGFGVILGVFICIFVYSSYWTYKALV